jgi:hypothetical protein
MCLACNEAQSNAASHVFNAKCLRCSERHFAHLPIFWESVQARYFTQAYENAINQRFGVDGAQSAHEAIKNWFKRIKAAKGEK